MTPERPRLRHIDAFVQEIEGEQMIVMRDPLDLTDAVLVLPLAAGVVLNACNGSRTAEEIGDAIEAEYGMRIDTVQIRGLLHQLEEYTFLDSPRFHEVRAEMERGFQEAAARPATLAGRSYAAEPDALRRELAALFTHEDGPGDVPVNQEPSGSLTAAVIPHIDYGRGAPTYGHGYDAMAKHCDADIFVILGTGHGEVYRQYTATWKDFETPFGTVPTDAEFLDIVQEHVPFDLRENELAHRSEHSIEFQAVLLQYLYGSQRDISIVPILCGSFHPFVLTNTAPSSSDAVAGMIAGLQAAVEHAKSHGKKVCFLASADLAHVGAKFGDDFSVDEQRRATIASDDQAMLAPVVAGQADEFFAEIQRVNDERRICGFPSIYTMLSALGPTNGELLQYRQWPDPQDCVTFASIAYYRDPHAENGA